MSGQNRITLARLVGIKSRGRSTVDLMHMQMQRRVSLAWHWYGSPYQQTPDPGISLRIIARPRRLPTLIPDVAHHLLKWYNLLSSSANPDGWRKSVSDEALPPALA